MGEPPAYPSLVVLESPKEEKPIKDLPVPHPGPGEKKTEVTPEVNPEPEKPAQEPTPTNNEPAQVQAQEKQSDEKRVEEKREVQQDRRSGQKSTEIELEAVPRQLPTAAANQRPQQFSPTFPGRTINRNPPPQASPAENKSGVTGWFKSLADF